MGRLWSDTENLYWQNHLAALWSLRGVIEKMLSFLTRKMRLKAAVFLAALYALTALAPHMALAVAGPGGYVHCLANEKRPHDHSAVSDHKHADDSAHSHSSNESLPDSKESQGPVAPCCGLFSVTALTSEPRVVLPAPAVASRILPFPSEGVDGQQPGRIIRPPIV